MWNFCRRNPALIVCLIVIPLAFAFSYFGSAVGESTFPPLPVSPHDERLTQIEREALDEAYRSQIMHLFEVWMKDDAGQPNRALIGARRARKAYVDAVTEIERRSRIQR